MSNLHNSLKYSRSVCVTLCSPTSSLVVVTSAIVTVVAYCKLRIRTTKPTENYRGRLSLPPPVSRLVLLKGEKCTAIPSRKENINEKWLTNCRDGHWQCRADIKQNSNAVEQCSGNSSSPMHFWMIALTRGRISSGREMGRENRLSSTTPWRLCGQDFWNVFSGLSGVDLVGWGQYGPMQQHFSDTFTCNWLRFSTNRNRCCGRCIFGPTCKYFGARRDGHFGLYFDGGRLPSKNILQVQATTAAEIVKHFSFRFFFFYCFIFFKFFVVLFSRRSVALTNGRADGRTACRSVDRSFFWLLECWRLRFSLSNTRNDLMLGDFPIISVSFFHARQIPIWRISWTQTAITFGKQNFPVFLFAVFPHNSLSHQHYRLAAQIAQIAHSELRIFLHCSRC